MTNAPGLWEGTHKCPEVHSLTRKPVQIFTHTKTQAGIQIHNPTQTHIQTHLQTYLATQRKYTHT